MVTVTAIGVTSFENREPRTENQEPGTENQEPRTGSQGLGVRSRAITNFPQAPSPLFHRYPTTRNAFQTCNVQPPRLPQGAPSTFNVQNSTCNVQRATTFPPSTFNLLTSSPLAVAPAMAPAAGTGAALLRPYGAGPNNARRSGSAKTCTGGADAITRPSCITTTVSAHCRATVRSWVASSTVTPCSTSRSKIAKI